MKKILKLFQKKNKKTKKQQQQLRLHVLEPQCIT